ncbi:MAG: AAA family ATPase, partial [Solirubrobacterales bacterium]
ALAGADAGAAQVPRAAVEAVLARHPHLGADQRQMVLRLTCGGEQVIAVAARPGTGKTAALEAATEVWEQAGFPVIGCATARSASAELKALGIPSTSIRALLIRTDGLRAEGKAPLGPGTVILGDEPSMTSTPDLEALRFLAVECGGKLVPIGDPLQIGAIGPGGLYAHYTRVSEPVRLTTIRRQHREPDRRLVALLHEGRGSEALDLLRGEERVIVGEDLRSTLDGILADWHRDFASGSDAVMIARRNRDVDYLNDRACELRREQGELGEREVIVGERAFAVGDRVQTRINREGALNRERWEVSGADAAARTLSLRSLGDGHTLTLGPRYLDRRREDGGPSVEHAYALTIYGAQGKTVDRAFVLLDGEGSLEQHLVALSRGREGVFVYAVASNELLDPDLGPAKREVADELQDIRAALEREGSDFAAAEVALRRQIAQMPGRELTERRAGLIAAGREADPLLGVHQRLSRKIAYAEEWVKRLRRERKAIEAMKRPPAEELGRVRKAEKGTEKRLRRLLGEREALPEVDPSAEPLPLDPTMRLEAVLIERRIEQLARHDVEAARLEPTNPIYEALGSYPGVDPEKARTWQEGAHVLASFRRRNDVRDGSNPLGPRPRDAEVRVEWERTRQQVEWAQRELGRIGERSVERDLT